jgi:hypothetical protein
MKFMIIVKASAESEAGVMPSTELMTAMMAFNEEMAKAGVMKDGDGLHPTSNATRILYKDGKKSMVKGPFHEPNLMAGYWIIEAKDMDDAIGWMMKAPNPYPGDGNLEIRQFFGPEDFGEAMTTELREMEDRLRATTQN